MPLPYGWCTTCWYLVQYRIGPAGVLFMGCEHRGPLPQQGSQLVLLFRGQTFPLQGQDWGLIRGLGLDRWYCHFYHRRLWVG